MTTTLVLHHGGDVTLPAGRYWVGDPVAAGLDVPASTSTLDGLYVLDGIVVGVFCRSLHADAQYGISDTSGITPVDVVAKARDLTEPPVLRGNGTGVAIVRMPGVPGLGDPLPATEIHGFVMDPWSEFQIGRSGADQCDITLTMDGSYLLSLDQYIELPRAPTTVTVVDDQPGARVHVRLIRTGASTVYQSIALMRALTALFGEDVADRLRTDREMTIGVADAATANRMIGDLAEINRIHDDHVEVQTSPL